MPLPHSPFLVTLFSKRIQVFLDFLGAGGLREHKDDSRGLPVPHGQKEEKVLCKKIF